jgi:hypothetical protein
MATGHTHLHTREPIDVDEDYQRLRGELEAAYRAAVWDSASLDRITAQLARLERALASNAEIRGRIGRPAELEQA